MSDWILVKEDLPEKSKTMPWLVYTDNVDVIQKYICRAWYIGVWVDVFGNYLEPTHYRSLPNNPGHNE